MNKEVMIEYFAVEIKPWLYPGEDLNQIKVQVNVNGREYNYSEVFKPNDMVSRYDQLFALVKKELESVILEDETR